MTADHPLVRALGWALLHFVWQGALLAGLAALAMRLLRARSPQARYAVGCAALLLMVAAPVATGLAAYDPAQALAAGPLPGGGAERQAVLARLAEVARQVRPADAWRYRVEAAIPSLVAVWLAGILVLSLRLVGGWGYAQRLARREVRPATAALQRRLDELARRLELSRPVRLLESARVRVPTVVGWLRPVVLLPLAAAAGLTPAQLEAVLLHELAHVRRHDYLVNLLQSAAEVLLFYHPGVWWVSERVREEREACCDDVAVAACGDALVYARALTRLEGLRAAPPRLAMAADGGSLLHRVRRLVLPAPQPARGAAPLLLGALLLAGLAAAAAQRTLAPAPAETAGADGTAPAAVRGDSPVALDAPPAPAPRVARAAADARPAGTAPAAPAAGDALPAPTAAPEEPGAAASGESAEVVEAVVLRGDTLLLARLRRIAAESGGSEEKVRRLVEVSAAVTRDAESLDAYLDAAATIPSSAGRRAALAAVLGSGTGAPRPARAPAAERTSSERTVTTRRTVTVEAAPARPGDPAPGARRAPLPRPEAPRAAEGSLAARLERAEAISSASARREALAALLREQAARPE